MRLHWKVELEFQSSQPGGYSRKTRFLGRYSAVSVLRHSNRQPSAAVRVSLHPSHSALRSVSPACIATIM